MGNQMIEFEHGYPVSRDYARLCELIDGGAEIVCWVDFRFMDGKMVVRDIAKAKNVGGQSIMCRGILYIGGFEFSNERFISDCKEYNVAFIDPAAFTGLLEALDGAISQACSFDGVNFDSMALSAYADGIRILAEHGRMKITEETGDRISAERINR